MSATLTAETIAALPVEPLLEQLRAQGIRIPRPAEVRDYLLRYPDMAALIRKVCAQARAEFTEKATLSLELYIDPEIDDAHLKLYVQQDFYDDATWAALERIQEDYADELAACAGWLHVMPDFRAPVGR